jgi:RNA polymerase-binding transcription factor DksA
MEDRQARRDELTRQRDEIGRRIRQLEHNERRETDNAHEWENADVREAELAESMDELQGIDEALQRIAQGTYGICERCGESIAEGRLEALPAAVLCINCAEASA